MKNVKEIFDRHCSHLSIDRKLLNKVMTYEQQFVNKNETHIAFFGGNLMGVHPVRFKDEDRHRWFTEILDVDEFELEDELHALPDILAHRHVSSDVMNLSCFWLAHRFMTESKLTEVERNDGAMASILILHYKFITSILADWFKWQADPIVAQTTYTMLNKRFGLKVTGSWGALLRLRANEVIRKGGLHHQRLLSFNKDLEVVYMVNDTQGRVKDILKNIRDVFTIAQNSPETHLRSSSSMIELDGELKVRDKTRLTSGYMNYLLEIVGDKNSFVIPELVDVIVKIVKTIPKQALEKSLTYMSDNASPKADKRVQRICEITLQHAFDYLARNPGTMSSRTDVAGLLNKMRTLYQSSRTTNPQILEMRETTEKVIQIAIGSKNQVLIASTRNAVLLYILLRTFTMHHYRK